MTKNDLPGSIRVWAVLVLTAVFIIGAAAGAAIWHVILGNHAFMPPPMMGPLPMRGLNLSAEQQEEMDEIFQAHRPELDAVLAETAPKVRAINEKIEARFLTVLTDEQKKRFDEMKAQRPAGPPFGMPFGGPHGRPPMMGPPGDKSPPERNE